MAGQDTKTTSLPACQQHGDAALFTQHIHHSLSLGRYSPLFFPRTKTLESFLPNEHLRRIKK
jgi:hypothetical protein